MRRTLLRLALASVLALSAAGCGADNRVPSESRSASRAASGAPPGPRFAVGDFDGDDYQAGGDADDDDSRHADRDGDADNPTGGVYDADDASLTGYGRPASARERLAVTAVVKRYLAAAGRLDGTTACSLVLARVAAEVPKIMGTPGSPPYEHGVGCGQLVSSVFRFYRRQLEVEARAMRVAAVRVAGDRAVALLSIEARGFPIRTATLERERGRWRMDGILDEEVP